MPTTRIGTLESGKFARRQGSFIGIGTFPRTTYLTQSHVASSHIEDGGNDLSTFVKSALPKIEEFLKVKLASNPE